MYSFPFYNNVDRYEPLVDGEGYPRNDIDVFAVRHARHDLICKENDMKQLMNEIAEALNELHQAQPPTQNGQNEKPPKRTSNKVFALVTQIAPGSPAESADLKDGDRVVQFGSATADSFTNIKEIADIVQHSTQSSVRLTVIRGDLPVHLTLKPRKWEGRGLLGCLLTPIK